MDNATDPDKTGAHFNFPILGEIFQLSFLPAVQEVLSNLRRIILTINKWARLLGQSVPTPENDKCTVQ